MGLRRSFKPTNLVSNGDFRYGTSGWGGINAVVDGIAEKTATAQYSSMSYELSNPTSLRGHKIYVQGKFKADSTGVSLTISDGIATTNKPHSGDNTFETKGVLRTINQSANNVYCRIQEDRPSGWTKYYADNILAIDLTALLPAELLALSDANLKAWCDANIPVWFDGTMSGGRIGGLK